MVATVWCLLSCRARPRARAYGEVLGEGGRHLLRRLDAQRRVGAGELVDRAQRLDEVDELLGADVELQAGAVLVGDAAGLQRELLGELQAARSRSV